MMDLFDIEALGTTLDSGIMYNESLSNDNGITLFSFNL